MKPVKKINPQKNKKRNVKKINQIMIITGIEDIHELERLLNKEERKTHLEKRRKIREQKKKPRKPLSNQPLIKKEEITIDPNLTLMFIKMLLDKGLISKEELASLTLKEDNPLKQVEIKTENVLDKSQLRQQWLYLMKHNELYCALCGHPITMATNKGPWKLTAEHTIPRSRGGATDSTNLVPAHSVCNSLKSDIMPDEWNELGLEILRSYGIHVDTKHSLYKYLKEKQK